MKIPVPPGSRIANIPSSQWLRVILIMPPHQPPTLVLMGRLP